MPFKTKSARREYIRTYMQERRSGALPKREQARRDTARYLQEATLALHDPRRSFFAALVIWRDATHGLKSAQAVLSDPRVAGHVGRALIRMLTRSILGWAVQLPVPKSLAESTTPEVQRVAHLVDCAA